ncbi:hypothetical protein F5887DRAFT_917898 [Amanita rubescens]|nr:hypothetical protein F5887DRAFT_917898 [Amanita rubescens]
MPKELRDTKLNSPGALRGSRHLPYPNPLLARPSVGFRLSRLIGSTYEHTQTSGKSIPGINSTQHVEKPSTKVKNEAPTASHSSRRATSVSTSELITHTDEHTFGSSHNSSTQSVSRDATRFKATHAPRVKREVLRTSKSPGESTVTPVIETCRLGQTPTRSQPKSDWLEPQRLSSLKPDSALTSRELQRSSPKKSNEPAIARGLDSRRKLPSESSKKTESSVSHTLSRKPNTHDKRIPPPVLEPSVLVRKLPDKSTGVVGSSSKSRVVAAVARCAPSPRVGSKLKFQIGNKTVSTKERESAADYAPLSETASSLSKPSSVSSIWANPPIQLNDELILAPFWLPKRCEPRIVNARSITIHQAGNPRFGEPPAARESIRLEQTIEAKGSSPLLPEISNEHIPAHLPDALGFVSTPGYISSFSGEMGEKRQVCDTVVSIQNVESEEVSSPVPEDSMLPVPASVTSPVPALPATPAHAPSDELTPPFEVVPIRRNLNVVSARGNKDEEVSSPVPPTRDTAPRRSPKVIPPIEVAPGQCNYSIVSTRRGSEETSSPDDVAVLILPIPTSVTSSTPSARSELLTAPSDTSEGRPPAKAVVYTQERTTQCSSILNDSVRRIPKVVVTASESKLRIGKIVSARKLTSSLSHVPSAKETSLVPKPSPVSSTPTTPPSQLHAKLNCSPLHVSKRREVHVTNKKPAVSKVTHQKNEARSRVPEPALNVRAGKNLLAPSARKPQQLKRTVEVERNAPAPLETSKESVIERSTSILGPSNIRVQSSLLSIELGEKRRIYDTTVVNIQHISEEMSSPNASVASTLSVPAPATSSVQVEAPRHPLDEDRPPIEAVSRQHGLNVVNDRTTTVRRQSNPNNYPSEVSEGRHLASAAAYVQERKRRRSLDYDGNVRHASKGPPDKSEAEFTSLRQALSVIRKETEASVDSCSPRLEPEEPESSPVQPKAAPQQLYVPRAIGLSTTCSNPVSHHPESTLGISHVEVSESRAERFLESVNVEERVEDTPQDLVLSNEEETRLRDPYAINNKERSVNLRSPSPRVAVSSPYPSMLVYPVQAYPILQLKSIVLQLDQPFMRLNVGPDCLDSSRQKVLDVVSGTVGVSINPHSPASSAVPTSFKFFSSTSTSTLLSLPTTQLSSALRQLVGSSTQSNDLPSQSRRYPCDVVSQSFNPSAAAYSPQPVVVLTLPIPKRASQAIAFDLGCSLGRLLRMTLVLSVITFRAIHNCEAEETEYTIIHEDDKTPTPAPPSYAYVDAKATANAPPSIPPEPSWWAETPDSTCVKRIWRTRHKPPDVAVNYRRQNYSVVNKTNFMSEHHSHLHWAETMPPKSMNFVLGNDPDPEAETTTESGHSLTHERRAESPRCQYPRSSRPLLASP